MIWIHLGPDLQPQRLGERFLSIYGASAEGRRASTRLTLPGPASNATVAPWTLRRTDIDQLGHVNNAAYWIAVEEQFALTAPHRAVLEYRQPLDLGDAVELRRSGERALVRRRRRRARRHRDYADLTRRARRAVALGERDDLPRGAEHRRVDERRRPRACRRPSPRRAARPSRAPLDLGRRRQVRLARSPAAGPGGSPRGRGGRARGRGGTSGEPLEVAHVRVDRLRRPRQARRDGGVDDPAARPVEARLERAGLRAQVGLAERDAGAPRGCEAIANACLEAERATRSARARRAPSAGMSSGRSTFGTMHAGDRERCATASRSAALPGVDADVDRLLAPARPSSAGEVRARLVLRAPARRRPRGRRSPRARARRSPSRRGRAGRPGRTAR